MIVYAYGDLITENDYLPVEAAFDVEVLLHAMSTIEEEPTDLDAYLDELEDAKVAWAVTTFLEVDFKDPSYKEYRKKFENLIKGECVSCYGENMAFGYSSVSRSEAKKAYTQIGELT